LIKASGDNIVVVTFNYRVGPYGFLAGKEIETRASLNNGLKDQRKALEWVHKHISKVGRVVTLHLPEPIF
jgi:carboxylesterase type B